MDGCTSKVKVSFQVIAKEIGHEVTAAQCRRRWNDYLKYMGAGLRSHVEWTVEEVKCPSNKLLLYHVCICRLISCRRKLGALA